MVKMSTSGHSSDDSEDTVTSTEDESSDSDHDDSSDSSSLRSLAFSVKPRNSKVTVKSKKSNKRVRFKPGDSLVLIYIIPNREMLGLKSDSEDSDECEDSDDDSDDDDSDKDDDEEEEDDTEEEDDDDDEDDDDEDGLKRKNKIKPKKPKPFAKLIAVKQLNRRKLPEVKNAVKAVPDKPKEDNTVTVATQAKGKKLVRGRLKKDKKENSKLLKARSINIDNKNTNKTKQYKTNNAIKVDKRTKGRRNRSRLLEIRATVQSSNSNKHEISPPVLPKLSFKSESRTPLPPPSSSSIDVNNSVSSKQLSSRTKLQPTSFRISKPGVRPNSASMAHNESTILPKKESPVSRVVSTHYSSLTSVLPDTYVKLRSLQDNTVEETIKRLDPDNMNTSGKRNYAWQIANGTITSQSLRTPSILPFWDSLQNSVTESNTIKLPT